MPYDHSTKIGNQGDVAKHVSLYAALRALLDRSRLDNEFCYVETHAGRPTYILPEDGEWRFGIGRFSTNAAIISERKARQKGTASLGVVGDFDEMFVGRSMTTAMAYPGSAGIAFRVLRAIERSFRMKLWEYERAAADDLERYFHPSEDRVATICGNGYDIVGERSPISFVLIDPPSLEQSREVLSVMQWLHERSTPFLCWMPRTSRSIKSDVVGDKGSAAEAGTSVEYITSAGKFGIVVRLQWHGWGHRNPGCCITASGEIADVVIPVLEQLSKLMEWQFEQ